MKIVETVPLGQNCREIEIDDALGVALTKKIDAADKVLYLSSDMFDAFLHSLEWTHLLRPLYKFPQPELKHG